MYIKTLGRLFFWGGYDMANLSLRSLLCVIHVTDVAYIKKRKSLDFLFQFVGQTECYI